MGASAGHAAGGGGKPAGGATGSGAGPAGLKRWKVAAAIIENGEGLLLVQNLRRNGMTDWSTPGGVIEEGESTTDGLAREVEEETGIVVRTWRGPVYEVDTMAPDMGWHLAVEVYEATDWAGDLAINDPDGIVVEARFVPVRHCAVHLAGTARWVKEPMCEWLGSRFQDGRTFAYELAGTDRATMVVTRR